MAETVAITGANGFVGSAITLETLSAGYQVRAIVRRSDAASLLTSAASFKPFADAGTLTCVVLPDLHVQDGLLRAIKDCAYVIHVAAPTLRPPFDNTATMIQAHVDGTVAILDAAKATHSVKRVAFTSSTYAIQTLEEATHFYDAGEPSSMIRARLAGDFSNVRVLKANDVLPVPNVKAEDHPLHYYIGGKVASRKAILDYMDMSGPNAASFSVALILPGCVFGPAPLARTRAELLDCSNLYMSYLFSDIRFPCYLFSEACHIDDVAEAHVKALRIHPAKRVQSFLIFAQGPHGVRHEDAADLLEEEDSMLRKRLPMNGQTDTLPSNFDIGNTESELLGRPLLGLGRMARDLALAWESLPP